MQGRGPQQLAEDLKDIPPMHQLDDAIPRWARTTIETQQGDAQQVVLVIRGDLLKRYPNTFIYAQKAAWGTGSRGEPPRAQRRDRRDFRDESAGPAPAVSALQGARRRRTSTSSASISRSTRCAAIRGSTRPRRRARSVGDNIGWFFVLQEAVGEPRFGLDVDVPVEPSAEKWDNLAWANVDLSRRAGSRRVEGIRVDAGRPMQRASQWGSHAADMAYVLYQDPVMVGRARAQHARETHRLRHRRRSCHSLQPSPTFAPLVMRRSPPRLRRKSAFGALDAAIAQAEREGRKNDATRLRAERATTNRTALKSRADYARLRGQAFAALASSLNQSPESVVNALSDQCPFVLLPVRIETSFAPSPTGPTLRVRFYPDDISLAPPIAPVSDR